MLQRSITAFDSTRTGAGLRDGALCAGTGLGPLDCHRRSPPSHKQTRPAVVSGMPHMACSLLGCVRRISSTGPCTLPDAARLAALTATRCIARKDIHAVPREEMSGRVPAGTDPRAYVRPRPCPVGFSFGPALRVLQWVLPWGGAFLNRLESKALGRKNQFRSQSYGKEPERGEGGEGEERQQQFVHEGIHVRRQETQGTVQHQGG